MKDQRDSNGWVRPASRAGIRDPRDNTFITSLADVRRGGRNKQLSSETCVLRLDDLEEVHESPAAEPLGKAPDPIRVASKMIAFFGPKGGTGATTLALNVGGALLQARRNVVVADMDLQLGAVPVSLNMKPERSVAELAAEAMSAGDGPITSGLDRHGSGLTVVAQGDRIEELASVTVDRLPRLFDALAQTFEFVLVDGLRDFSDHAVATMDLAHKVVMVVTQDVPAVRAAARSLRIFRRLGYGPERINIVVNRYHRKAPVTLDAIHNALGQPVDAVVCNDFPLAEQALNHGVLIGDIKPGAPLARDLEAVARFLAELPPPKARGGFFAKLFGRG